MRDALSTKRRALLLPLLIGLALSSTHAAAAQGPQPAAAGTSPQLAARIQRIEDGFAPIPLSGQVRSLHLDIRKMMQLFNVPGLSVAVIDDYRIVWAKGYGVTAPGGNTPVT